jgi:predicted Rossmann fold nucleotide-binding protein DprA/Smf involved in DNA uptake
MAPSPQPAAHYTREQGDLFTDAPTPTAAELEMSDDMMAATATAPDLFSLISTSPQGVDDLIRRSGQPELAVLTELTLLELQGRIRRTATGAIQLA